MKNIIPKGRKKRTNIIHFNAKNSRVSSVIKATKFFVSFHFAKMLILSRTIWKSERKTFFKKLSAFTDNMFVLQEVIVLCTFFER